MIVDDKTYFLKSNIALYIETLREFSAKPFEVASLNNIIKNSEFNKGSFYYRFNDKFDLYCALLSDVLLKQSDYYDLVLKTSSDNHYLKNILVILFNSNYSLMQENKMFIDFLKFFYEEDDDFKNKVYINTGKPIFESIKDLIVESLKTQDHFELSNSIIFMNCLSYMYFGLNNYFSNLSTNDNNIIINMVNFLLSGLSPESNYPVAISADNISFTYKDKPDFKINLDFNLKNKEILVFVGPSNAGKTTIYNLIVGKTTSDTGNISYLNNALKQDLLKKENKMSFISSPKLNRRKNGRQNLAFYAKLYHSMIDINVLIESLNLSDLCSIPIRKLSDSSIFLLEILCSYIAFPKLLLLDDLHSKLIDKDLKILNKFLEMIRANGTSIVIFSSHLKNVYEISDRLFFLVNGKIEKSYTKEELKAKYDSLHFIVKYKEFGIERNIIVSEEDLKQKKLQMIIDQYDIISIETQKSITDEVFKYETGVCLN